MLFFVLNVKNDRLDATLIIIFFGRVYRCNFNFNFRQYNNFMIIILTLFLKYCDVNLIYLVIYLRRINRPNLRWPLGNLKNKNLNLTKIKCSNHISKLN